MMNKRTLVKTDAPGMEKFTLVVKGMVEKRSVVEPQAVYLNGIQGDLLKATIRITPSKKDPFTRLEINRKTGASLITDIVPPASDDQPWQVHVQVQSDKVTHVFETVIIKTDNPNEPEIRVRVSANFSKKK
jgi:hypothetical protein